MVPGGVALLQVPVGYFWSKKRTQTDSEGQELSSQPSNVQ
jgi:hypothetical protein